MIGQTIKTHKGRQLQAGHGRFCHILESKPTPTQSRFGTFADAVMGSDSVHSRRPKCRATQQRRDPSHENGNSTPQTRWQPDAKQYEQPIGRLD